MAVSRVQTSGKQRVGSANTLAFSYVGLPTVGNYLFISVAISAGAGNVPTVTDNQIGNTWLSTPNNDNAGDGAFAKIFYCKVVGSSGTFTATINGNGASGFITASFDEWTGLPATLSISTNTQYDIAPGGTSQRTVNGGSVDAPTVGLSFALLNSNTGIDQLGSWVVAPGAPWTNDWQELTGTAFEVGSLEYQIVTVPATLTAMWSLRQNDNGNSVLAFFGSELSVTLTPTITGHLRNPVVKRG